MPEMRPFPNGPALKIERAKHHINDLNRQAAAFFAERPFKLFVCQDGKSAKKTLTIKAERAIPSEFALIIGDAVHNLRSALDLCIFGLVGHLAPKPTTVQFPFAWKPESLESTITSRQVHLAGEKVISAIRDLQPYPGGNEFIVGIQLLDLADKHKLVLPVGRASQLDADSIGIIFPESRIRGAGVLHFSAHETDDLFIANLAGAPRRERRALRTFEYETHIQPIFVLTFGPGQPFDGREVISTLIKLASEAESAVDKIFAASRS